MKSLRKHIAAVVLVAASGTLLAQPAQTPPADPAPSAPAPVDETPPTAEPSADPTATLGGAATVTLSEQEMVAQVTTLDAQTESDAKHVVRLQIVARKEKDVIKLNCINDKLLQIKAILNIIEGAKIDLEQALGAGTKDEQYHQFTRITMAAEDIRKLKEEANGCAGEIDYYGASESGFQGPDIPDDPAADPFPDDIEPPGYASPFD